MLSRLKRNSHSILLVTLTQGQPRMTGKNFPGLCIMVIKFEVDTSSGVDVGAISRRAGGGGGGGQTDGGGHDNTPSG